jgi:hypothetical protein
MRSVGLIFALAAVPYHALAEPVEHPDAPAPAAQRELAILIVGTSDLDPDAVRAAIAADLGVQLSEAPGAELGALAISIVEHNVRIEYRPITGPSVERTVALPAAREDRARLIAFIATNLVRDQTSELLAELPPPAPPAPPAATPMIAIPTITRAEATSVKPRVRHVPLSIGFVPPFSIDRLAGENVVVGVGVNAIAGSSDGSQIASVSGVIDTKRHLVTGVQIGGVLARAGRLDDALQIGGVLARSDGPSEGLQIGGAAAVARGDLDGVQIGGAGAISGELDGLQIGGAAAIARGRMRGVQIAGGATIGGGSVRGLQVAGAGNVAERVDGVQVAGGVNVAGDVRGLQVGVVNVAGRMRGVQLGVVNLSSDGDGAVPIGVINYSKNGPLAVDAWVDSSRVSAIGFRHGTRYVHNLWALGWSPDHEHVMVGAGIGVHHDVPAGATALGVDVDAMHWLTDAVDGDASKHLSQLRASLTVPLGPVAVFAGVAANVHVADDGDVMASEDFHPVAARRYTSDGGTEVTLWPTAFAGARLRLR